jgi:branched-chain amino acid transport system substrate-binding protein
MANKKNGNGLGRRGVLTGLGAGLLPMPFIHSAGAADSIKVGLVTSLSGPFAVAGRTCSQGLEIGLKPFNDAGGLNGRKVEVIKRDSKSQPDEAVRVTRELMNSDGCQIIIEAENSAGAFAVHQAVRDAPVLVFHCLAEAANLTADPKMRLPNVLRTARTGWYDAFAAATYADALSRRENLKHWVTFGPDYALGRDANGEFIHFLTERNSAIQVDMLWAALTQQDFAETITRVAQMRPDGMYNTLIGNGLSSFIEQGQMFDSFAKMNLLAQYTEYQVLTKITDMPAKLYGIDKYYANVPDTAANRGWYDTYKTTYHEEPTHWSWQSTACASFIVDALKEAGSEQWQKMVTALRGRSIISPFGADGKLTLREIDGTLVGYAIGCGHNVPKFPYVEKFSETSWSDIFAAEIDFCKRRGYA